MLLWILTASQSENKLFQSAHFADYEQSALDIFRTTREQYYKKGIRNLQGLTEDIKSSMEGIMNQVDGLLCGSKADLGNALKKSLFVLPGETLHNSRLGALAGWMWPDTFSLYDYLKSLSSYDESLVNFLTEILATDQDGEWVNPYVKMLCTIKTSDNLKHRHDELVAVMGLLRKKTSPTLSPAAAPIALPKINLTQLPSCSWNDECSSPGVEAKVPVTPHDVTQPTPIKQSQEGIDNFSFGTSFPDLSNVRPVKTSDFALIEESNPSLSQTEAQTLNTQVESKNDGESKNSKHSIILENPFGKGPYSKKTTIVEPAKA